mgnify:CR=1 FL=1
MRCTNGSEVSVCGFVTPVHASTMFCQVDTQQDGVLCAASEDVYFLSTDARGTVVVLDDGTDPSDARLAQNRAYTVYESKVGTLLAARMPPHTRCHPESMSFLTIEAYLAHSPNAYMCYLTGGSRIEQRRVCGLSFPVPMDHVVLSVAPVALRTIIAGEEVCAFTEPLIQTTFRRACGGMPAHVIGGQIRGLANVVARIGVNGSFFQALHSCEYNAALGLLSLLRAGAPSAAVLLTAIAHSAPSTHVFGLASLEDHTPCAVKWNPTVLTGGDGEVRIACKINDQPRSIRPENIIVTSSTAEAADVDARLHEIIGEQTTWRGGQRGRAHGLALHCIGMH